MCDEWWSSEITYHTATFNFCWISRTRGLGTDHLPWENFTPPKKKIWLLLLLQKATFVHVCKGARKHASRRLPTTWYAVDLCPYSTRPRPDFVGDLGLPQSPLVRAGLWQVCGLCLIGSGRVVEFSTGPTWLCRWSGGVVSKFHYTASTRHVRACNQVSDKVWSVSNSVTRTHGLCLRPDQTHGQSPGQSHGQKSSDHPCISAHFQLKRWLLLALKSGTLESGGMRTPKRTPKINPMVHTPNSTSIRVCSANRPRTRVTIGLVYALHACNTVQYNNNDRLTAFDPGQPG